MKIISSKKWEELEQEKFELQMDLKKEKEDNKTYQAQVKTLQNKILKLQESLETEEHLSDDLVDTIENIKIKSKIQTDTIRKLKTLLTKNNIDYKTLLEKKAK